MGAEIIGADVSKPVPLGTFQRFKDALHEYKVLVFRDQDLTKEQLIAFSKRWGPLGEHIMPGATRGRFRRSTSCRTPVPTASLTASIRIPTAKRWHTDRSYMPRPAMATLLYGVEVPSVGGDTLFANGTMAYDTLPGDVRKRIDTLNAIHSVEHSRRDGGVALATEEEKRKAPPVASARAPASGDRTEGDLLRLPCVEGRRASRRRGARAARLPYRARSAGAVRLPRTSGEGTIW